MPAGNRVCCLLSAPLAAVGSEKNLPVGVEGELKSLPKIDTENEQKNLESALKEGCADTGRSIELEVRYATLDALRSVVTLGARVIHFAGHGHPEFLCFEDKKGTAVPASNEALRKLVSAGGRGGVRLVVVNSCHSRRAGESFVAAGVSHVVAVGTEADSEDNRVTDRAAASFCRAFYLGIIAGKSVQQAFEIGCAAADRSYVLLPKNGDHSEKIFADAPFNEGTLHVVLPKRSPSNAPVPPTFYLGRNKELFCLVDSMLRHRLTTVAGAFGFGKSALVAAACAYHAERGNFDAIVWVRLQSSIALVDDVLEATRTVLLAPSVKNNAQPEAWRRITSFSLLHHAAAGTNKITEHHAANFLREKSVLIILDDFERLVLEATPKVATSVRNECQKAMASLLAFSKKTKVVLTCARGSGLGRSTSVTERVIKLEPLDAKSSARLLLQRSPELARRATNVKAVRGPRVPPNVLISITARHAIISRLAGNPLAIALSATLLNALFDQEDQNQDQTKNDRFLQFLLKSQKSVPAFSDDQLSTVQVQRSKSTPEDATNHLDDFLLTEPLDRLLSFLDSTHMPREDDPETKIRDEINAILSVTANPIRASSDEDAASVHPLPSVSETEDESLITSPKNETKSPFHISPESTKQEIPRCLDRRVLDGLALALLFCWLARLIFDAFFLPSHAFYLRFDTLLHFLLDLTLLLLLASFLPEFQRLLPTTAPPSTVIDATNVQPAATKPQGLPPHKKTTIHTATTKPQKRRQSPIFHHALSPQHFPVKTSPSSSTSNVPAGGSITPPIFPYRQRTISSDEDMQSGIAADETSSYFE
uniref:CHAT domain-containing protein n=1 Tax=Aureoumbra lagunensis TaxID=44058 RepID=A0A7S3NJB5_9STRA|mmetsp:Transcript_15256/g.22913  ORF Transcript_15256/g.22913 Transcript_15256/m.22913 type:complete len:823 (+) Transcript_15256:53-2521(+)